MNNLARKLDGNRMFEERGEVVRVEEGAFVVKNSNGEYHARRATSCLLEPLLGDVVLVAAAENGDCYVLAILERAAGVAGEISYEGDLSVRGRGGRLGLVADEGVDVCSAGDVKVVSGAVHVSAAEGSVVLDQLTYLGSVVKAEIEKAKVFAKSFDSVFERLTQRVKRSYRTVEEYDQLKAKEIDYEAKGAMKLHAENTVMTAEGLVRVDGDQIHLG